MSFSSPSLVFGINLRAAKARILLRCMSPFLAHRYRCQRFEFTVGIGGRADMKGRAISANSDANDPKRS